MAHKTPHDHKLAEAVPDLPEGASLNGMPEATHEVEAHNQRAAQSDAEARNAQADLKDRLVDVGKAHHMGGRSNGRVGDQS